MLEPNQALESAIKAEISTEVEATPDKKLTPLQAIRAKCLDCSCENSKEVKLCSLEKCPSWPYRFGRNPYRKKPNLTDEQKQKRIDRLTRKEASQTTSPTEIIQ